MFPGSWKYILDGFVAAVFALNGYPHYFDFLVFAQSCIVVEYIIIIVLVRLICYHILVQSLVVSRFAAGGKRPLTDPGYHTPTLKVRSAAAEDHKIKKGPISFRTLPDTFFTHLSNPP